MRGLAVWLAGFAVVAMTGCVPTPVAVPPVTELANPSQDRIDVTLEAPPLGRGLADRVPLPQEPVPVPGFGDTNGFGLVVGPVVAQAYMALAEGRPDDALHALELAEAITHIGTLWQVSALRVDALAQLGRLDDALLETEVMARRERTWLGHDLNATARRGDLLLEQGDVDAAFAHYADVDVRTRDWRLPTDYVAPPSNLAQVVALTQAQLTALAGIARVHFTAGRFGAAAAWAAAAEERFNDVHLVAADPQFGAYVPVYFDSYFQRARNLGFLGAARLAAGHDPKTAAEDSQRATDYFEAIGYTVGIIETATLRALALAATRDTEAALRSLSETLALTEADALIDLRWRLRAVQGELLHRLGRTEAALEALTDAHTLADDASGVRAVDRSVRRFGIAKVDITYRLARIALERGDAASLVTALQRGRAQHILDLTANLHIETPTPVAEVRRLDGDTHRQRLARLIPLNGRAPLTARPLPESTNRAEILAPLIRAHDPRLGLAAAVIPDLSTLQAGLDDGERMVLAVPARGADALAWVIVEPDSVRLLRLQATAAELEGLLEGLADAISLGESAGQRRLVGRLATALNIASILGPAVTHVVLHGDTVRIPWAAFDLESPVVTLAAPSHLLRAPHEAPQNTRNIVLGDPADQDGQLWPPEGSVAEAVARMLHVEALAGQAATGTNLRQALSDGANVLHLATTTVTHHSHPLQSAILLAASTQPTTDTLTAGRLFEAPLPARFALLASTRNHLDETAADMDRWTIPLALQMGGTQAVVHSLWAVDDVAARAFAAAFYDALNGSNWAAAWLAACASLKAQGFPPAVYGAYVLSGAAGG